MGRYLSLLRGINVGKSRRVSKDALLRLYAAMNFRKIEVFIQSGNVLFSSASGSPVSLASRISKGLMNNFGDDIPVAVLDARGLKAVLKRNPHKAQAGIFSVLTAWAEPSYPTSRRS